MVVTGTTDGLCVSGFTHFLKQGSGTTEKNEFSRERQRKCTCAAGLGVGGAGNAEEP